MNNSESNINDRNYYSNVVNVQGSPYDIQFSFYRRILKDSGGSGGKEIKHPFNDSFLANITMSYQHAKEFNKILTNMIRKYESDFGEIITPDKVKTSNHNDKKNV